MSVYTPLDTNDIASFVSKFNLSVPVSFQGIKSGTVNSNFCLNYPNKKFILTLFETLSAQDVDNYMELQNFLSVHKFPSPKPVKTTTNHWHILFKHKPGVIITFLEGASSTEPTSRQCEQAGIYLAKLHVLAKNYANKLENPLGRNWRNKAIKLIWDNLKPDDHQLLNRVQDKFNAMPWSDFPMSIIHNDYFRDNVHFKDDTLSGIIDYYYAAWDCCLFDLCISLNDWCTQWDKNSMEFSSQKYHHFLAGYQSIRPLTPLEQDHIKTMLQITAWHFWIYRHFVNLDKKSGSMISIKDPEEFKLMLLNRLQK